LLLKVFLAWFDDLKIVKGNLSRTTIVEESNYYPFGLKHKGYNNVVSSNGNSTAQKFGFGGKELNQELGLEWMDFDARNYDAAIGRWMNIDPLAELLMSYSPYVSSFNNPIYFTDPTGMLPSGYSTESDHYITDYYRTPGGTVIFDPTVGPDNVPGGGTYIGPTYTNPLTGTFWDKNGKPHEATQQLDEVVITANSSSSSNDKLLHIWGVGTGLQGNGQTGSGISINHNDIGGFSTGGAPSSNAFIRFLEYMKDLLRFSNDLNKLNESTMKKKVDNEAKNVPDTVTFQVRFYGKYRFGNDKKTTSHWYTVKGKKAADSLAGKHNFGWYGENIKDSVSTVKKYE
jgi:RHS repeat-associated protein